MACGGEKDSDKDGEKDADFDHIFHLSQDDIIRVCASLESGSSHPIASAIVKEHERLFGTSPTPATDFENLLGHGLIGVVDGKNALLGNAALMQKTTLKSRLRQAVRLRFHKVERLPFILQSTASWQASSPLPTN